MMQFKAVLGNAKHPEYGLANIPFPIPQEQYDSMMEMMNALEIGDALARDCWVAEIDHGWPILKRLEKVAVNIDELDYLVKRLDSFDAGEAAQFQGMAVKRGVSDMTGLIDLTFCCQQATVITDFSDLNAIGRNHLLNLNGGCMSTAELNGADGRMVALSLILNEAGTVTPYGVVYDNGMELEQFYDGRHFPAYYYDSCLLGVAMSRKDEPEDTGNVAWLYLPLTQTQIERAMTRAGIDSYADMRLRFDSSELPNEIDVALDFEHESLDSLNEMCKSIARLGESDLPKLAAAVAMAKPEYAMQVQHLAEQLDLFDFAPAASTPLEYGQYLIRELGHLNYDEGLDEYYDYEKYALDQMKQEYGEFTDRGYISYHGTLSLDELMHGSQGQRMEHGMGGMGGMA